MNAVDPLGMCEAVQNPDGSTSHVGICGTSQKAADLIQTMINDPNSTVNEVEQIAVSQGQMVEFEIESTDLDGNPVNGALTGVTPEGQIIVTLDDTDQLLANGYDVRTGADVTNHPVSDAEALEHEIGQHVRDRLTGGPVSDERSAIQRENQYRARNGDTFRRVGHGGTVRPRR